MLRQKKASHSEQNERQSGYQRDTYSHYENQRRDTMRPLLNQNRYPQGKEASQEKRNEGKQNRMPGKSSTGSKTGSPRKAGGCKALFSGTIRNDLFRKTVFHDAGAWSRNCRYSFSEE